MHKTLKWLKSINLRARLDPPLTHPTRNYMKLEKRLHNWFYVRALHLEWMWLRHWWIACLKHRFRDLMVALHLRTFVNCKWCEYPIYTRPGSGVEFCSRQYMQCEKWWKADEKFEPDII